MKLSEKDIISFQKLYKKVYNKDISSAEAYKQASDLLYLVELTYKPMTRKEYLKYYGKPAPKN